MLNLARASNSPRQGHAARLDRPKFWRLPVMAGLSVYSRPTAYFVTSLGKAEWAKVALGRVAAFVHTAAITAGCARDYTNRTIESLYM